MSERYLRGIEVAEHLAAGKLDEFLASRIAELAPDFARMAIEFPLGDIYTRDGLDLRSREIVAIACLAAQGDAGPQLRIHVHAAMQIGVTKTEIIEMLMQTSIYAGFPAALNAIAACHDLLADDCPREAAQRAFGQDAYISGQHCSGCE